MDLMDYRRRIIANSPHLSHAEGAVASFADGTDLPLKSLVVNIEPVQSGTGDPSPTNVRPISGWDAVGVHDAGVNVWDEDWENGDILTSSGENAGNINKIRSKNYIPVKGGQSYYLNINTSYKKRCFYDKDKGFISGVNTRGGVVDVPVNACYMRFATDTNYGGTYNNDISVNFPSTDQDYHPYTGTSITIQLGRTVYGGKLDVLSGELVVDRAMVDLGTLTWFYISQSGKERFYSSGIKNLVKKPAANTDNANIISSAYETFNVTHAFEKDKIIAIYTDGDILLRDTSYTDTASLKTALSGVMLVYELATPQTYTLDPQTVRSLVGHNNIFADTGNVALDYWAHP